MVLMLDNYDSFTWNIVQYLGQLNQTVQVLRNDEASLEQIAALRPDYIVVGPGPCSPKEAGISLELIRYFAGKIPLMGVCLGHQAMGEAFGGQTVRAQKMMHGKVSDVHHDGLGMFAGLPNPVVCTRYHSLVTDKSALPDCWTVSAWTEDGEIMGIRHNTWPLEGVQFHPEALLTEHGHAMFANFIDQHRGFQAA